MNSQNCTLCGASLAHLPDLIFDAEHRLIIFNGEAQRLCVQEAIVFGEVYRRFGHSVQTTHLVHSVWGLDEPENPLNIIAIMFCRLRKVLAGSGYHIPPAQYGRGYDTSSYTLCFDASLREAA